MDRSRVLIIESCSHETESLSRGLEGKVGSVILASCAAEGLAVVEREMPDMILLDLSVGFAEASDFLHGLEQEGADFPLPVIVLADSDESANELPGIGRSEVLRKPASRADLTDKIEILLEVLHLRQELAAKNIELQKLAGELSHVLEMKNRFLDLATHDLRTPITTIKLVHDILEKQMLPERGPGLQRVLDILARNVAKVESKIMELLLIARMDLGDIKLQVGRVELGAIVEDAISNFFPGAISRGIDLDAELKEVRPLVGDARRIGQLACELIACALERLDTGGRVVVEIREEDEGAVIRVKDNGPALQQEMVRQMLAGLENLEPTSQTRASLYAAYQIARSHKGRLQITGDADGGAVFSAWLPFVVEQDNKDGEEKSCRKP